MWERGVPLPYVITCSSDNQNCYLNKHDKGEGVQEGDVPLRMREA